MNTQTLLTFSSVYSLGVWRCAGLRLRAVVVDLGELLVFLASIPYYTRASSSGFCSPWPVRSRLLCRFGSNPALKPTRIPRAAHLVR